MKWVYRDTGRGSKAATIPQESLMLTTDENIVNVRLAVQYQINNAGDYLFNVKDREATLKQLTEPAAIDKNYAQKSAANALRPSRSKS